MDTAMAVGGHHGIQTGKPGAVADNRFCVGSDAFSDPVGLEPTTPKRSKRGLIIGVVATVLKYIDTKKAEPYDSAFSVTPVGVLKLNSVQFRTI